MLANLLLLPALLLTLEKSITTEAFKEPLLDIFDEEEDIDLKIQDKMKQQIEYEWFVEACEDEYRAYPTKFKLKYFQYVKWKNQIIYF